MELEVVKELQKYGLRFEVNKPICVYMTYPDIYFPEYKLCVYIDGPPHNKKHHEEMDQMLRDALRKRGYKVLEIKYDRYSKKKAKEIVMEIMSFLGGKGEGL